MAGSEFNLLGTKCPHPITNEELQKWTNLKQLEEDFERYTKASLNYFDPKLAQEAFEIFKVPADFEKTEANVIDLRLCAYIKFLKLFSQHNSKNDFVSRKKLFNEIHRWPNIIGSFIDIDEGPDVHWFFRHRVMEYIKVQIYVWPDADFYRGRELPVLTNERLDLDHQECHVIIREIIYPKLELIRWSSYSDVYDILYIPVLQSVCNRRKTTLSWAIEFAWEKLDVDVDQVNKAMSMLQLLLEIACDKNDWDLFDESLAAILRHPRDDIRERSNSVFALLVRHDATKLENIAKHFEAMLDMFNDRSAEVRESNQHAWLTIARDMKFGPKARMLLCRVVDLWKQKLHKTSAKTSRGLKEELVKFVRLIMPKLDYATDQFDLISESCQFFEDLKWIAERKKLFRLLCKRFYDIHWDFVERIKYSHYVSSDSYRKVAIQYHLILGRAGFMLAKHFDARKLDNLALLVMGDDPDAPRHHYCNSKSKYSHEEAEYFAHCELLVDIFNHLNERSQIKSHKKFRLFFSLLQHVGYLKWNEERMRATESCLITAFEENIKLDGTNYLDARFERCLTCRRMLAPLRLAYFDKSRERLTQLCEYSNWNDDLCSGIRGIQSRRMVLVSMCKLAVMHPALVFDKFISCQVDLLDELQLAYELRASQGYPSCRAEKHLLPTCTELAFASAFDDPKSSIYICEFVYFKDTLKYLKRKHKQVFDETISEMGEKKRERLDYYLETYNKFNLCCTATSISGRQARFQCIDHRILNRSELKLCPLLRRESTFDCM